MKKISVLAISHSCLVAENNKQWDHLAMDGRFEVKLLVPPRFRAALRDHRIEKTYDPNYEITPARTWLSQNRYSNHLHFYVEKIRRLLHDGPPDIVFVQEEPWSLVAQQAVLLRDRASRFVFYTAQNQCKRYPFPFNLFQRNALRASDAAVSVCDEGRDALIRQGYTKPVYVLPHGVDTTEFTPSPERRRQARGRLGLDGFVIGYIGRLAVAKGIFDLLDALKQLGPDFSLMVIGDGPDKESFLRRADELALGERVTMVGTVSHSDVPALMPAMDALALPSHTTSAWKEQFGRVLIEAMSCGVPVIGSSSGEIPRTIGEAGVVFPETDSGALADAIRRLRASPQFRRRLVVKGLERARRFSWPSIASRLGEILLAVFQPTGPERPSLPADQSFAQDTLVAEANSTLCTFGS